MFQKNEMNPYYAVQPQQSMNQYPPVYQQSRRRPRKEKDNTGTYVLVIVGVIAFLLISAWALGIWPFSPSAATSSSTNPTKDTGAGATPPPPGGSGGVTPPASGSGSPTATSSSAVSTAPNPAAVAYQSPVSLQNQGAPGNGLSPAYLNFCGLDLPSPNTCGAGAHNVTLPTDPGFNSDVKWHFISTTTPTSTGQVNYGDVVQIQGTVSGAYGPVGYLTLCDKTTDSPLCGANVVSKPQPDGVKSTWKILDNQGASGGNPVLTNDTIYIESVPGNEFLSLCGQFLAGNICGENVSLRTDNTNPPTSTVAQWKVQKSF